MKQHFPEHGQAFPKVGLQPVHVAPPGEGLVQAVFGVPQHGLKLLGGNGLEQIAHDLDFNGLPGVLKVIVPAENQKLGGRGKLPYPSAQGQPVHQRHANIRHQQIRLQLFAQLECLHAVARFSHHGKAQFFKGHHLLQALTNFRFVVAQDQLIHAHPPRWARRFSRAAPRLIP